MKKSAALLLVLLIAGCDLTAGDALEDKMRADALSRASSDCGAANSCRVSFAKKDTGWVVSVTPSAMGTVGDPQFNSGAEHRYQYDAKGKFVGEAMD